MRTAETNLRLRRDAEDLGQLCPVDRLPRRRRNKICIAIIIVGLFNFLLYTVSYAAIGGDARNGERRVEKDAAGNAVVTYIVRGHFIRSLDGQERPVSAGLWIYSYLHSISVPITSAAMVISMLVLARPHILSTMRDGWLRGETFVTAFGTIVILLGAFATILFAWDFASQLAGH